MNSEVRLRRPVKVLGLAVASFLLSAVALNTLVNVVARPNLRVSAFLDTLRIFQVILVGLTVFVILNVISGFAILFSRKPIWPLVTGTFLYNSLFTLFVCAELIRVALSFDAPFKPMLHVGIQTASYFFISVISLITLGRRQVITYLGKDLFSRADAIGWSILIILLAGPGVLCVFLYL